jgi:hypothetical protein
MLYVDSALLDMTEWVCRRLQVLTGRTNVWLAFQLTNLSIIVFFIWAGMHFLIVEGPLRIVLAVFCGGLLYLLTQTILKVPIETYENNEYRRVARGLRNPRRVRDVLLRVPFLTLSVFLLYPVVFAYLSPRLLALLDVRLSFFIVPYFLIVLTTVMLYLLACDPLPPCPGKVREWLRGLAPARSPAPEIGAE